MMMAACGPSGAWSFVTIRRVSSVRDRSQAWVDACEVGFHGLREANRAAASMLRPRPTARATWSSCGLRESTAHALVSLRAPVAASSVIARVAQGRAPRPLKVVSACRRRTRSRRSQHRRRPGSADRPHASAPPMPGRDQQGDDLPDLGGGRLGFALAGIFPDARSAMQSLRGPRSRLGKSPAATGPATPASMPLAGVQHGKHFGTVRGHAWRHSGFIWGDP